MAFGLVRKPGAATMTSLIEACISLLMPFGNFGLLSVPISPWTMPSNTRCSFCFQDTKHSARDVAPEPQLLANATGTILVASLVLVSPGIVLLFLAVVSAISDGIGGFIANMVLSWFPASQQ